MDIAFLKCKDANSAQDRLQDKFGHPFIADATSKVSPSRLFPWVPPRAGYGSPPQKSAAANDPCFSSCKTTMKKRKDENHHIITE